MPKPILNIIPALAVLSATLFAIPLAVAQDYTVEEWSMTIGAGAVYSPIYEGSGNYKLSPIPYVNVKWRDRVTLGVDGLTADVLKNDTSKVGAGLVYDGGRDEDGGSLFRDGDDDRLRGVGDIDGALGVKAYAAHDFEPVTLSGSVTQFLGDENDGLLAKAAISKRIPMSQQLFVTPSLSTTWASENYTQTFFGVNAGQEAQSRFAQYNAESGFKDVTAGVGALYAINENVFIISNASIKQLVGDAADSPISEDDTSAALFTTIGYKF